MSSFRSRPLLAQASSAVLFFSLTIWMRSIGNGLVAMTPRCRQTTLEKAILRATTVVLSTQTKETTMLSIPILSIGRANKLPGRLTVPLSVCLHPQQQKPISIPRVRCWSKWECGLVVTPATLRARLVSEFLVPFSPIIVSDKLLAWAGGTTDYSAGPYTMYMKSISVTDYSTGTSYTYGDQSGSWESIKSNGGTINGNIGAAPKEASSAPAITSTASSGPIPWSGTHKETSSFSTPSIYPWVPESTTLSTATSAVTSYSGLPSGWTVTSSGKVQPPSAASVSEHTLYFLLLICSSILIFILFTLGNVPGYFVVISFFIGLVFPLWPHY